MEHLLVELSETFVKLHRNQLEKCGLPQHYWNALCTKLKDEIFDAGSYFQIVQIVDEDDNLVGNKVVCSNNDGLATNDPLGVFLVDHAWTYRVSEARKHLNEIDSLAVRMKCLMNIQYETDEDMSGEAFKKLAIDGIIENMWKYNQTYNLTTENMADEDREPLWYIMDEFGSSIRHGDAPNVKCTPFYYLPTGTMFTIVWPVGDIAFREEITRDYANGVKDELVRRAKLVPWLDNDCTDIPSEQEEPNDEYFTAHKQDEILPDSALLAKISGLKHDLNKKYKVFTDLDMVKEFLTDERYSLTDNQADADIIFIRKHFKDYKSLAETNPTCMINQFPYENLVTVKDLLAVVCQRVSESTKWLPLTYNLNYELPKFVSYFQQRENEGAENHWIVKPWNLARSLDMYVTKNLNQIIRLQETGPKIACKYISNPVLFHRDELGGGVKFDVRYIVLVRSIQPLTIYTYNVFWLRFANKPYVLDNFDDYETLFTVMNYRPTNLKQVNYNEFIPMFEQQYPKFKWTDVQLKIFKMIRQVFEGATMKESPKGFANYPNSRAMYAIDLMLDWQKDENANEQTIEPMICEINFMPDCTRACKFHPSFFNDVFNTLFLDSAQNSNVTKIC